MNYLESRTSAWTCALGVVFVVLLLVGCDERRGSIQVTHTVGDVVSIHESVRVDEKPVQGLVRIATGNTVTTSSAGRAQLRLDDGAVIAVDGDSDLLLEEGRITIHEGRVFVRAFDAPLRVSWGGQEVRVASAAAAFDLSRPEKWRAYCAEGELSLTTGGKQYRVEAGETASADGQKIRVLPEKAFEDWTGGLSEPGESELEGKSAIPHVRARASAGDAGAPLIVRSHQVDTKIVGEVALTKSRTTYFNGSDSSGEAYVRLALPEAAVLTRVAVVNGKGAGVEEATLEIAAGPSRRFGFDVRGLEWAGAGWLQGVLGRVSGGDTLQLILEYTEWLDTQSGRATYRYATATDSSQPAVGELAMRVDAQETHTPTLSVSAGAEVKRRQVTYRASDVRPKGDFVVQLEPEVVKENEARVYVERTGAQKKDAFIVVRTELPDKKFEGVRLAVVIDTSQSMTASLDTSFAIVETILESLGPKDSLVLLSADEDASFVGGDKPASVTPEFLESLRRGMAKIRPGGASNLSRALLRAADALDRGDAPGVQENMLIYIGDGRPTVGEPDAAEVRKLLSARPSGIPRLGAVAVGSSADPWMLARLVSDEGVVEQVSGRQEAARAGARLLTEALTPRYREVEIDLGPHVDRVYPRTGQVVTAGRTVQVVGRLRGPVPTQVGLSYFSGNERVDRRLDAKRLSVPPGGDLARKWAAARIAQIAREGEGIEPAISLAREFGLVTPWTSWLFGRPPEDQGTRSFSSRILELSSSTDTPYVSHVAPVFVGGSSLIEPDAFRGQKATLVEAAQAAMRRLILQAARSVRACRDARAAVRPEVGDSFRIEVTIDAGGATTRVLVSSPSGVRGDPALLRCIQGVVRSLPFVGIGQSVTASYELSIAGRRSLSPTKCSEASRVSLPVRREIWRSLSPTTADDYRAASERCELRRWTEKKAFLQLLMESVPGGPERLRLSEDLELGGHGDAADFVRDEALRTVETFDQLQALIVILRQNEPDISEELEGELRRAPSNEAGLEICRKYLRLSPHDTYARRRLLAYLEALGRKESLISGVRNWRTEAVSDAGLLADAASALLRLGEKAEAERVLGELIERAPRDPWTLAFVGDRLRAEGLHDQAQAVYFTLSRMLPDEAGVTLRLALSHAGAGRLDVASRLLTRVAQTGGRHDDGRMADLAGIIEATLLASARGGNDPDVEAELVRRLLRTPLPDAEALVLLHAPPASEPIRLELRRDVGELLAQGAEMDARGIGVSAARIERGEKGAVIVALRRDEVAGPSHPLEATVSILRPGASGSVPAVERRTVSVPADGRPLELIIEEGRLL